MKATQYIEMLVYALLRKYNGRIDGLDFTVERTGRGGELTIRTSDGNEYAIDIHHMGVADTS